MQGRKRGFTLVELLVAIAVMAVLVVGFITIVNPIGQFQKARDAKRKGDLHQLQNALQTYFTENGRYPAAANNQISGAAWGEAWLPYIGKLPDDPLGEYSYIYKTDTGGTFYRLYASLERCDDPHIIIDEQSCKTALCNYGVISPNVTVQPYNGTSGCSPVPTPTATP